MQTNESSTQLFQTGEICNTAPMLAPLLNPASRNLFDRVRELMRITVFC